MNTILLWIFLGAVLFDLLIGEPPSKIHPVVWMGKIVATLEKHKPENYQKLWGAIIVITTAAPFVIAGFLIQTNNPFDITGIIGILASIYLLKSTFSIKMLLGEAKKMEEELRGGDIDSARSKLPTFVSRNPEGFDEEKISSAVIESTSESYLDTILSPLFYFTLFGLPGALAYKAVSTIDSMIGYMEPPYRNLGHVPAKLDDILNYIPARISALMIILAATTQRPIEALNCARQEHNKTPSPNSGWPMAAAAGALRVRLEKPGVYTINPTATSPQPEQIAQTVKLVRAASMILIALVTTVLYLTPTTSAWHGLLSILISD